MLTQLYLLKTVSGLHCGVGQGMNDIDLPTARDPVTGHPFAPGSSFKGVLRDRFDSRIAKGQNVDRAKFEAVFGPDAQFTSKDPNRSPDFASCVSFGDARLVCLPVRSYHGTFAYLTSPVALALFQADLKRAGFTALSALPIPSLKSIPVHEIALTTNSALAITSATKDSMMVLLEELDLEVATNPPSREQTNAWANGIADLVIATGGMLDRNLFLPRFAIVCNTVFDFLCETALPVVTRNAINSDSGIVKDGALWSEEFIPAEAILVGLLHAEGSRRHQVSDAEALDFVASEPCELQLGGKATTGRGLVSLAFPKRPPVTS